MKYTYTLIKSNRKTISLELKNGALIVRAPNRTTQREADEFVQRHADWIEKHLKKAAQRREARSAAPKLTQEELDRLSKLAAEYIPLRVKYYAAKMGLTYGRITLRCQKTRWGSCSAKKNLNFNILLMLTPPEVIDSVVVHELCHLTEMNHSKRFYALVYSAYPEYKRWNNWLKEHGSSLIARVHNL